MPKVDPRLRQALNDAQKGEVRVVVRFEDATTIAPVGKASIKGTTTSGSESPVIEQVIRRVQQHTNQAPSEVTIFSRLGAAYIQAQPEFIERLLEEPEVVGATLNSQRRR